MCSLLLEVTRCLWLSPCLSERPTLLLMCLYRSVEHVLKGAMVDPQAHCFPLATISDDSGVTLEWL